MTMTNSGWPEALPRAGNRKLKRLDSAAPWFEVYQVSDGTFGLLEPLHYEEPLSYLIVGDERGVLFDTGMGMADIRAEVERLTALPVIVVNSHSDYDHVGDNYRFDEVWVFDDDYEVTRIERGFGRARCERYMRSDWYLELPPGFDPTTYEVRPSKVTRRLRHLEAIELGGRTLTVQHTPGHTPGSICLHDSRDALLFTGDTFYPGLMEASDLAAYLQSLKYLLGLLGGVSHLCPAHNEAYVPKEALARVLQDFERIAAGKAAFESQGEMRVYRFDGFSIKMPHAVAG